MIVPCKKTDNKKGDEDNTTAGKNCSKNNLRMILKNGKFNQLTIIKTLTNKFTQFAMAAIMLGVAGKLKFRKFSHLVSCLYKGSLFTCKDRSGRTC